MKKLFLGKIVKICKFYSWKSGPFFNYKMVHFSLDKYMATNLNQMARNCNRYGYVNTDKFNPLANQIQDLVLALQEVYIIPQKGTNYGNNKNMEV